MPTKMLTMPPITELVAEERARYVKLFQERRATLEAELQTTDAVLTTLQQKPKAMRAHAGNGARSTARKPTRRTRRTGKTATAMDLSTHMIPGKRYKSSEIAQTLGATPTSVLRRLKEMEKKSLARRIGTGAQLRWMLA